jgi:hypothetical protein
MIKILFYISISFLLAMACSMPTPSSKIKTKFHTTVPSQLYFKNVRSAYYKSITDHATKIDYYTLQKWNMNSPTASIIPIIADNWMEEEAYIKLAWKGMNAPTYKIKMKEGSEFSVNANDSLSYEATYNLVLSIRAQLLANELVMINDSIQIFTNLQERNYFLTTMQDYLRLIENQVER